MRTCPQCGAQHKRTAALCQPCYLYLKKHPEGWYPIPEDGSVSYAINGDPICHECGGAYRKLGNHIRFNHNMTQHEYKDKHLLLYNTRLSHEDYQDKMRTYNKKHYRKVVKKNLIKHGFLTRFKKGQEVKGRGKHIQKGR